MTVITSYSIHYTKLYDAAFSLGISELDTDHRKLIDFVNRIDAAAAAGDDDAFDGAVADLHEHLHAHFEREEKILDATLSPEEAKAHIETHRQTDAFFERVAADMASPERRISRAVIRDYLRHWLLDHVLVGDMRARDRMIAAGKLPADVRDAPPLLSRFRIGQRIWMMAVVPLVLLCAVAANLVVERIGHADGRNNFV